MRWLSTVKHKRQQFSLFSTTFVESPPLLKLPRREIDMFLPTNQRWPKFGLAQRLVSLVLTKRMAASGNEINMGSPRAKIYVMSAWNGRMSINKHILGKKTHRAETIASIRGKKPHGYGVIVLKQMADNSCHSNNI